jgi:type IV pilus assembly protein PilN
MTRINLLPWRANQREALKQQFLYLLAASILFTIILMGFIYFTFENRITRQNDRNMALQTTETQLEQQTRLLSHIKIIQNLQSDRAANVRLFDELIRILPQGVYLTEIKRENNTLLLTGNAESSTHVSDFMRRMEISTVLVHPVLQEINTPKFVLKITGTKK